MTELAGVLAEVFFPNFRYKWVFEETVEKLPLEMDFRLEAKNAIKCKEIFDGHPRIKVPRVFDEFTRERILVMEFMEGVNVTKLNEMHRKGIDLRKTAHTISEAFIHMIYRVGFVHGDPHPGNMLVRKKEGGGPDDIEVVLLDHGIYSNLPEETRLAYT